MTGQRVDHLLWIAFGLLFAIVAVASILPVRPLVWAFPLWAVVVLVACVATVAVALLAVRAGWPTSEGETAEVTDA